jgi:hypothetical protein
LPSLEQLAPQRRRDHREPAQWVRLEKRIASIALRINPEFKCHTVGFVRLAAHDFA